MEIDSILADGFSFQAWRKECTDRELCIRCAKPFDRQHQENRGCVLPDNEWLEKDELLKIWRSWGGKTREDCNRDSRDPFKPQGIEKSKKRELISVINEQPIKC
jgi:hypothetical protein